MLPLTVRGKLTLLLLVVATTATITCGHWLTTISLNTTEVSYSGVVPWTHWPPMVVASYSVWTATSHATFVAGTAAHATVVATTLVLVKSRVRSLMLAPIAS